MTRRLVLIGALVAALAIGGAVAGVVLAAAARAGRGAAGSSSPRLARPASDRRQLQARRDEALGLQRPSVCYEQAFGNVAYYKGPKAALALFAHEMAANKAVEAGCHRIAH